MNLVTLGDAVDQARRFLRMANDLEAEAKKERVSFWGASATTAAVKRASMDLTRALSAMRRPG